MGTNCVLLGFATSWIYLNAATLCTWEYHQVAPQIVPSLRDIKLLLGMQNGDKPGCCLKLTEGFSVTSKVDGVIWDILTRPHLAITLRPFAAIQSCSNALRP